MKFIYSLLIISLLGACNSSEKSESNQQIESTTPQEVVVDTTAAKKFWDKLTALCGKSFEGTLVTEDYTGDFAGKQLVMHLLSCDEKQILIPFNVGDNRSRTWILTYDQARITLKHDHRLEDGSDDEITMYGGTSNNSGSEEMITFPADQETVDILPLALANIWWMTVNDSVFSYNLRRVSNDRRFTVEFDLTQEIETPEPSWGWENFKK